MITVCGKCLADNTISPAFSTDNGPMCIVCGHIKAIGNRYYMVNIDGNEFNNFNWKDTMARQKLVLDDTPEVPQDPATRDRGLVTGGIDIINDSEFYVLDSNDSYFCSQQIDQLTIAKVAALSEMDSKAPLDRDNQGKYKYTSFNQFIVHTRQHLLKNGLVLTPIFQAVEKTQTDLGQGKGYEEVTLHMLWKLSHISGQWEIFRIISYANNQDRGGKHFSKALSYNIKDCLRAACLVPSGGDDDPDDDRTKDSLQDQLNEALALIEKQNQAIAILKNKRVSSASE